MKHKVTFSIPERQLGKADIEFKVKANGKALGTLRISKGAIVWVPLSKHYGYKVGWQDFNDLAIKYGRKGNK